MAKKKNIEENIVDTQEVKQEDIVLKTNTVSSEVQEEVQDDVCLLYTSDAADD